MDTGRGTHGLYVTVLVHACCVSQIVDQGKLSGLLASYLEEYNMEHKAPLNLGDCQQHLVFLISDPLS
jgi:hypothetical protein